MFVARDESGNSIYATSETVKDVKYFCPVCGGEVRLRAGKLNVPHFAHVELQGCLDDFSSDMSEWHRSWQMLFPQRNREVVITHEGESHRADVLCYGTVIEFQHSPISESEFWKRNEFYTAAGYRVVWIFDVIDLYDSLFSDARMKCIAEYHNRFGDGGKYKWNHPWRFLGGFMPQDEKEIDVFFQIVPAGNNPKDEEADCCMERVTWVNPDYKTLWGYFHTSYEVTNYSELLNWLKRRWERNKRV